MRPLTKKEIKRIVGEKRSHWKKTSPPESPEPTDSIDHILQLREAILVSNEPVPVTVRFAHQFIFDKISIRQFCQLFDFHCERTLYIKEPFYEFSRKPELEDNL